MSLPNNLNTNEVKNSAGTEVEFNRISVLDRSVTFAVAGESPNLPHRLKVSHQEIGTGLNLRRRSAVIINKTVTGASGTPREIKVTLTLDFPVGDLGNVTDATNLLAEIMSFCASLGASTTILYDGTGYGAAALINGSL